MTIVDGDIAYVAQLTEAARRAAPALVVTRDRGVPVGSALILDQADTDLVRPLTRRSGDPLPSEADGSASITVAICTRDRPVLLARCLDSVRQAVEVTAHEARVELLVVDNASSDERSLVVAAERGARVAREPVGGLDVARNRAVRSCATDLLAFVDDDVVVDDTWLRTIVRSFAANRDCIAVVGGVLAYALDTGARRDFERAGGFSIGWSAGRVDQSRLTDSPFDPSIGVGCNMAFRTGALRGLGPFDEALDTGHPLAGGGDLDILIRAAMAGPVHTEPSALVYHEHRATWAELRRQYRSWGTSWGALLHKWYVADPRHRRALRRAATDALRFYGHDLVVGPKGGGRRRRHAAQMLLGFVVGSTVAYPRSQRRMANRRRRVEQVSAPTCTPNALLRSEIAPESAHGRVDVS